MEQGKGIAGRVARDKKPLLLNGADSKEYLSNRICRDPRFEVKSVLSVPLLVKDKVIEVNLNLMILLWQ